MQPIITLTQPNSPERGLLRCPASYHTLQTTMEADTPRGWPRPSPSQAPVLASGSAHANPRPGTGGFSATALRQLNPSSPSPSTPKRPDPDRRSMLATRPVLVRAYSGDVPADCSPTMSRRFFPFSAIRSSTPAPRQPDIPLPSDKDFSIESILQAIEPDIRGTLDSIAEICGRSKLSLANEYGSHIAPLGEIIAPATGLGAVEPSPVVERADGVDEENIDAGRDMHPFSFHRYLENLRHTASLLDGTRQRSPGMDSEAETVLAVGAEPVSVSTPFVREFASRPNHTGRELLARNVAGTGLQASRMATSAVVSEVHLDARADEGSLDLEMLPRAALDTDGAPYGSGPEIIQSLIGWLNWTVRVAGPDSIPASQSAEARLRAMLDRAENGTSPSTVA